MTTNKVKPSDLATAWDGNALAAIHVHRPGNSQKATIRQIVEAAVAVGDKTAEIQAAASLAQQAKDQTVSLTDNIESLDDRLSVLESKPSGGSSALPGRYEIGSYCLARDVTAGTRTGDYYEAAPGSGITMMSLDGTAGVAPGVGTWRQMSWKVNGGTNYIARATIWMRIA
ncbi:hypothetical protein [Pseudomonas sp. MF6768]|uniref:hypothetical protein n=1 Tax=Pseudomonas sp. MF6768 TaxID=2797532 RepID=UPI0018E7FD1A|nr:hypothetical protein [Pseudomonas sp. MF6768]MBJ2240598.1 hypothetical protein [Pseudomonas sp. MF6768]